MTAYYVDAIGGNDGWAGTTPATAWQTIAKLNGSAFNPGDSILFKRGEAWAGTILTVSSSGLTGAPITFGAYGSGALPIISGNDAAPRSIYCLARQHVDFEYLDARDATSYAIDIQSSHVEIRNCATSGCGDDNISIGPNAHDVLVKDVVSYDPYRGAIPQTIACIEIQDGAYNVMLDNCECYGSAEAGININAHEGETMPWNILLRRCHSHDNTNSGITISNSGSLSAAPSITVDGCRSINNGYMGVDIYNGGAGLDPPNVNLRHCVLDGNTSYQARISGDGHTYCQNVFSGRHGVLILDATNLALCNNTIYNTEVGTVFAFTGTDNSGTVAKNNIVYVPIAANNVIFVAVGAQAGLDIDYNLYHHVSGDGATRWNWNGADYNWANWKTNSGQDANSPAPADPLFANATLDDFTLKNGSPALEAGVYVGLDYDGTAPNCGAYGVRSIPNASAAKFKQKLESPDLAVKLTTGEFMNPAQVRAATDAQLTAASVTDSQLTWLREVY